MFVFVKTIVISAVVLRVFAGSAHAETISPRRLLEVADLTALVTSPDGSSVAFRLERASVVRHTYDIFWYVQAMDGKAPPRWLAHGGVLLHDTAGGSLQGVAEWTLDGGWEARGVGKECSRTGE